MTQSSSSGAAKLIHLPTEQHAPEPGKDATPPPAIANPLLDCLERVGAWHGVEINRDAILAGLPVGASGLLTPSLLIKAAERAGFRAQIVERKLKHLPKAVLPAIIMLKSNRAAVLMPEGVEMRGATGEHREVEMTHNEVPREDYTGFAVLLRLERENADREDMRGMETAKLRARWFWRTLWRFRADYLRLLPASFLMNLFALAMPFFSLLVYNRVVPNNAIETLLVLSSGVVMLFVFEYVLRLVRGHVIRHGGRELDTVLASELYEQILTMELRARPPSAGALAARAKAYDVLREFFVSAGTLALVDLPFALLMIAVMFFLGGWIGWIVVGAVLAIIVVQCVIQIPLRRSVMQSSEAGMERQAFVSETINGLESVKAANAEGALQHRFEQMIAHSSQKDVSSHWYSLLGDSTTKWFINAASVGIMIAGVFRIQDRELTMGGLIACSMLGSRIITPFAMVAGLMTRLQQTLHALRNLNSLMSLRRETGEGRHFIQRKSFRMDYQLKNVSVTYPGQSIPALKEISLAIRPGERIALLGRMGSGKSTLLRVLAKLYEPTAGQVLLDGIDLVQCHPAMVRAQIGYLAQGGAIFCGTLRENIALGVRNATDEQIMEAVRMAGIDGFVGANSQGLQAPVGEQGSLLSGGQRQALTLARALLGRPKLLLLDEPTSSMDHQAEQQFISCLKEYLDSDPERSLVVATHKTSALELVKRVIVLHEGKIHRDESIASFMEELTRRNRPAPSGGAAQ